LFCATLVERIPVLLDDVDDLNLGVGVSFIAHSYVQVKFHLVKTLERNNDIVSNMVLPIFVGLNTETSKSDLIGEGADKE